MFWYLIQVLYKVNVQLDVINKKQSSMPFLYKVEIKQSPIEGKGVFALEDIPQGAVYWIFEDEKEPLPVKGHKVQSNIAYTRQQLQAIEDKQALTVILHGGFYDVQSGLFIQHRDGGQFVNHSFDEKGNIIYDGSKDYRKLKGVSKKPIKAGEEITQNYNSESSVTAQWLMEMMEIYDPQRVQLERTIAEEGKRVLAQ